MEITEIVDGYVVHQGNKSVYLSEEEAARLANYLIQRNGQKAYARSEQARLKDQLTFEEAA